MPTSRTITLYGFHLGDPTCTRPGSWPKHEWTIESQLRRNAAAVSEWSHVETFVGSWRDVNAHVLALNIAANA